MAKTYPFNIGRGGAHLKNMKTYLDEIWGAMSVIGGGTGALGNGRVFYCDGIGGSDGVGADEATNPSTPMKTLNATVDLCEDNRNDYIIVMDCWAQDTFPVAVDTAQIHIIGLGLPSFAYPKMNPATDAACFNLTSAGAYSEIAGFDLSGGDSTGCIDINGTEGSWIHHNWFGSPGSGGTPLHGIYIKQNIQYSRFEQNRFFGDLGSSEGVITGNGIQCNTSINMVRGGECVGNVFDGLAIGINLDNADYWVVDGNTFVIPNAQNGEAISVAADCLNSTFLSNMAVYGMLSSGYSYNPYRDLAVNTVNNWALNYRGNSIVEPVGV